MKRILCTALALLLLLTACAPGSRQEQPAPANEPQQTAQTQPEPSETEEEDAPDAPAQEPEAVPEPSEPDEAPAAEDEVPVLEPRIDQDAPMLTSLSVDGGYALAFSPELRTYELRIPGGRPRVPRLSAEAADGCELEILQAAIPDSRSFGTAQVTVTDPSGAKGVYDVLIVKDRACGFQLQYLDQYVFQPEHASGEPVVFVSSNPNVIEVTEDGTMCAKGVSSTPVTVEAQAGGKTVDSLTVDKVVNAVVNICLITGQSNAAGTLDIPDNMTEAAFTEQELQDVLRPAPGASFCVDANITGGIERPMYDLSEGRIGFSPALGKTWYDLTGEKTIMIQTAVGGAPMEAWLKPTDSVRNTYLLPGANFYETTVKAYRYLLNLIDYPGSGYEINHTLAFWLHGETNGSAVYDPNKIAPGVGDWNFTSMDGILITQEYFDMFNQNMTYFREELNVEHMGILLVRNTTAASTWDSLQLQLLTDLTNVRCAQYTLNNDGVRDVGIVSRVCDIARKETWPDKEDPGWGLMGCKNLHYNQEGHNANGIAAAENTAPKFYCLQSRTAAELEWIKSNGRDQFEDQEVLTLAAGASFQTAAMVLPMYTDTSAVVFTSADSSVCTVDLFGRLYAAGEAGSSTTVTVSCPGTELSKTITVRITA